MSGIRSRPNVYGHAIGPDPEAVAVVAYSDETDAAHETSLANARLIAAAPDLLAALNELMDYVIVNEILPERSPRLRRQREAIAKARGL